MSSAADVGVRDAMAGLAAAFGRGRPPVGTTPADVVFRENKWSLLRYRARPEGIAHRTPVLLVPSLINRHYVLDLLPGKSFAEDLVKAGFDVFIIDWGSPSDEDRFVTFDDVTDRAIARALRAACRAAGTEKAHVLGYCLGGTLVAIHAAAHANDAKDRIASLTLVAAPIRFDDDGLLARWTQTPQFDVNALVDGMGNVPWQLMQGAFQMLRPTLSLHKAVSLIHKATDDAFLDGFFALETWGSDNVSFPGECYRTYIEALYRRNELWLDRFALSGKPARLSSIACPVHVVTFEHDNIVPWQSASCVMERVASTDKVHLHVPGGHVGAMVSSSARKKLWPSMQKFWAERDRTA